MFDVTCIDKYGNTVTNLTQWDMNQTLYIEDHGFSTPPQFHFCNKNSEKALVVQSVDKDGVLEVVVPNILLIEPHTITAYVYLNEGDSSRTVEYVQIPVRQRPQPDSFEYEDNVVLIDVQELANEIRALNASMSSAEEERVASELNRISNEKERQNAEADRRASETIRISAETERVDAENVRKENEDIRVENENVRTSSEQSRVSAETERINKENVRQENESARQTAETDRIDAEADRIEAESNRADAEVERIEAENNRSDAEVTRVSAENERISAEQTRQLQEEERQTNTSTAIANVEVATERANVAAEACEGIIEGTGLIPSTEKGLPNGVATLDTDGKVPLEQLPDDISGGDADTLGGHGVDYFATAERVEDITNGTTQVGDTKKFDGHTVNDFAEFEHTHGVAEITDFPTSMPASDVKDWAKADEKPEYIWSEIREKPSTFTPDTHNQAASTITAGTLGGKVNANATAQATLTTAQLRDAVILESDPGEGASVSYAVGSIVFTK